jgi:hypothetical protein
VLLLFLALGFVQYGVHDYKKLLKQKEIFQEIEKTKVEQFINYRQYGTYGFRMIFVPDTISLFFLNSCVIPDMTSFVDAGERLQIYSSLKGKKIFSLKKNGFTDFSGIVLFFGSLLALFYGYDSFRNSEYLKFITTISSTKKVFFSIILSRVFLMFSYLIIVICSSYLLVLLNGLIIPINMNFIYFILLIYLITFFFFLFGTSFSAIDLKINGIIAIVCSWFFLVFILPMAINIYIEKNSESITPVYKLEIDKLKIYLDYEKRSLEKAGILEFGEKPTEAHKELLMNYLKKDFKRISAIEENMKNQMKKIISKYKLLSMFFPTTFYISINNEISSRGYENLIEFYDYVKTIKKDSLKFFTDKIFLSNFSKVESFIKDENNVYYSKSIIPDSFGWGIIITIIYIISILIISYKKFKKSLFRLPKKEDESVNVEDLKLKSGELKMWNVEGDLFNSHLYNLLSNEKKEFKKKGYSFNVSINDYELTQGKKKENFIYLCHPKNIPNDFKVRDFLTLVMNVMKIKDKKREKMYEKYHTKTALMSRKKFGQLRLEELGQVFLELLDLKPFKIFLINDAAKAMPGTFAFNLKKQMEALRDDGALVLFLTTDVILTLNKMPPGSYFRETYTWLNVVEHYEGLEDTQEKKL